MKLASIQLTEGLPSAVTVEMSAQEALYVALLTGKQTGITADEVLPVVGNEVNSGVYYCLAGDLFNRFYDGGVAEAAGQ